MTRADLQKMLDDGTLSQQAFDTLAGLIDPQTDPDPDPDPMNDPEPDPKADPQPAADPEPKTDPFNLYINDLNKQYQKE